MDYLNYTTNNEKGKHLNYEKRLKIEVLARYGLKSEAIAKEIGCSGRTVRRELDRGRTTLLNSDLTTRIEYSADIGQQKHDYEATGKGPKLKISNNYECDDLSVIAATGEAFGHFQMQLSDFDGSVLFETIPDFHNTRKRLDTFFAHVSEDPCGRVEEVKEEIEYISSVRLKAGELSDRFAKGDFPVRVTHNDTKCNNVLFDRLTKRPLVVIDLDTVMPGMAMVDFGDAVRFIASTANEDEPELSKVYFDTAKFRAFCKGYIGQVKDALTESEINTLVLAAFTITVELATRFLDDYICGDTYFKINYPGHNLVRTRCQLHLAQDIMKKFDELNYIVRDELEKSRITE